MALLPDRARGKDQRVELDRNGLEVLGREECLALLASTGLGRLGVTSGALPAVLPVRFWVDAGRILFVTDSGSRLDAAARDAVVAFEVDQFEPHDHTGWSVMVTGMARAVDDPAELARIQRTGPDGWVVPGAGRLVSLPTDFISGRRIVAGTRRGSDGFLRLVGPPPP